MIIRNIINYNLLLLIIINIFIYKKLKKYNSIFKKFFVIKIIIFEIYIIFVFKFNTYIF